LIVRGHYAQYETISSNGCWGGGGRRLDGRYGDVPRRSPGEEFICCGQEAPRHSGKKSGKKTEDLAD